MTDDDIDQVAEEVVPEDAGIAAASGEEQMSKAELYEKRALSSLNRARKWDADGGSKGPDREILLVQAQVYALLTVAEKLGDPARN